MIATARGWIVLGAAAGVVLSCVVPNQDHCFHQAVDPHAWCEDQSDGVRPYCSPCMAEHQGCVDSVPDAVECPEFEPPPDSPDTDGQ